MVERYLNVILEDFDNLYIQRYVKFILYKSVVGGVYSVYEKHHILPVKLYPSYKSDKNNIIQLTPREHFLVHWFLAKGTKTPQMWFAFNMMRRIGKNSLLYQYARPYINQSISNANKGRPRSQSFRENISKRFINKIVAKDANNNHYSVYKDDDRVISGELIHVCVGRKHSSETKNKISQNGIKDKIRVKDTNTDEIKFINKDEYSEKHYIDNTDLNTPEKVEKLKSYIWITNEKTKKSIKWSGETLPNGYYMGRHMDQNIGFQVANEMINVVDLKNKKFTRIYPKDRKSYHGKDMKPNSSLYIHDGYIFCGVSILIRYLKNKGIFIPREFLKNCDPDYTIPKPHWNNSESCYQFRLNFAGKSISDFNIEKLEFEMFQYKDYKHMEVYWDE